MSVPISTIVNVQISRQTQAVTQAGFGIPLILGDEDTNFGGELVRSYLNITEVLDDFTSSDSTFKAATAIFAQSPAVTEIKIGAEGTRVAQVATIVFSAPLITGNTISTFTVSSGGQLFPITATPFNTDNDTTVADLAAKLLAIAPLASAVVSGTDTITITAAKPGVDFSVTAITVTGGVSQATVAITTTVANVGVADFLTDISDEDDDWFGLIWIERDEDQVATAAAAIETRRKIFGTASADTDILDANDTDDIGTTLSAANFERTFVIFNADTFDFADAAWMGKLFPFDPGNATWKFKTLSGITADTLTSSQRAAADGKNVNLYVRIGGVDMTQEGVMASGEFIDVIRGVDFLQARLEEAIFSRLVNLPKIPFTDAGIAIIETEIRTVLENAIRESILSDDPQPIVTVPKAVDVSVNDRAERLLPDITFEARLAGAIHKTTIQGVVTV